WPGQRVGPLRQRPGLVHYPGPPGGLAEAGRGPSALRRADRADLPGPGDGRGGGVVNGWGGNYRQPIWRQPVGWGALHETPPVITAPVVRESPTDWLFNGTLRPPWAYRRE